MASIIIKEKKFIYKAENENDWWHSHIMAPSAIKINESIIRIYAGCWDIHGISRIGYIDVLYDRPDEIIGKSTKPILDIGLDGTFDENGVFPGHATIIDNKAYLYYTGFQLGHKIRHYNFGGLAVSDDFVNFKRVSQSPVLDRSDEGLYVRAGQSIILEKNLYKTVYSAGSGWALAGDKQRPIYDIYYQESSDPTTFSSKGSLIVKHNPEIEHGLGRPQIIKYENIYLTFYTRRVLNMKYSFGCAVSKDCRKWDKLDNQIIVPHGAENEFDSEMVYFPSALHFKDNLFYLFYSGNGFGKEGLGILLIEINL